MKHFALSAVAALLLACGPASPPAPVDAAPSAPAAAPAQPSSPAPEASPVTTLPDFDAEWNYGDPAASRARFTELLAAHADAPGPAAALWRLELRTQIARTHSLAREFDEAHAVLDAVDAELAPLASSPDAQRSKLRSLLERGRTWNSAGDKARARALFEEAWALGRAAGIDGLSVDAAHMVAIAAMGTDDELPWGEKALALARTSTDPAARKWRGSLLNNLGWTFHERGDFDRAMELFDQQIAVRRDAGKEPALRIALWARARCLRSLKQHETALTELRAILSTYGEDASGDGFVHEELAENLLALGKAEEARPAFRMAHELLATGWLKDEEPDRLARLKALGAEPVE